MKATEIAELLTPSAAIVEISADNVALASLGATVVTKSVDPVRPAPLTLIREFPAAADVKLTVATPLDTVAVVAESATALPVATTKLIEPL